MQFTVYGQPQSAGSKKHVGNGRVIDSNSKAAPWKDQVAKAGAEAMVPRGLFPGALELDLVFYVPRPAGHFGKRGLLPSAPAFPAKRPDVLKLARAVEDALTGVVWRDDAQIVNEYLTKRYGEPARVEVRVVAASDE